MKHIAIVVALVGIWACGPKYMQVKQPTDPGVGFASLNGTVLLDTKFGESLKNFCLENATIADAAGNVYKAQWVECYPDVGGTFFFPGLPAGQYQVKWFYFDNAGNEYKIEPKAPIAFTVEDGKTVYAGDHFLKVKVALLGGYDGHEEEVRVPAGDTEREAMVLGAFEADYADGDAAPWVAWVKEHSTPAAE